MASGKASTTYWLVAGIAVLACDDKVHGVFRLVAIKGNVVVLVTLGPTAYGLSDGLVNGKHVFAKWKPSACRMVRRMACRMGLV
jgi:hypothetical protein